MYARSVAALPSAGAVKVPVTVLQASADTAVLPTQVYAGSTTKRADVAGVPAASFTCMENVYWPPGCRRSAGVLTPS